MWNFTTYREVAGTWPSVTVRRHGNTPSRCFQPCWRYSCRTLHRSQCTAEHSTEAQWTSPRHLDENNSPSDLRKVFWTVQNHVNSYSSLYASATVRTYYYYYLFITHITSKHNKNTHVDIHNTVKILNYTRYKAINSLNYAVSKCLPDTASDLTNRHVQTMNIILVRDWQDFRVRNFC